MNLKKTGLLLILISLLAAASIASCGGKNKEAVLKEPAPPQVDTFEQLNAKIDELTNQIIKNMTERKKNTIAVIEFTDLNGKVTDFGRFLSEKLITKLFLTKSFNVIERSQLNKVTPFVGLFALPATVFGLMADPFVFIIHKIKPEIVPVEKYGFFNWKLMVVYRDMSALETSGDEGQESKSSVNYAEEIKKGRLGDNIFPFGGTRLDHLQEKFGNERIEMRDNGEIDA